MVFVVRLRYLDHLGRSYGGYFHIFLIYVSLIPLCERHLFFCWFLSPALVFLVSIIPLFVGVRDRRKRHGRSELDYEASSVWLGWW